MFDILKEEFKANTAKMQQIRAAHEKRSGKFGTFTRLGRFRNSSMKKRKPMSLQ